MNILIPLAIIYNPHATAFALRSCAERATHDHENVRDEDILAYTITIDTSTKNCTAFTMPSTKSLKIATSSSSDRKKSSKIFARKNSQKKEATSPKKLRRSESSGSKKREHGSKKPQKMKSFSRLAVGPMKKGTSATLEKNSSSETEESKSSRDEIDIHRGFYV